MVMALVAPLKLFASNAPDTLTPLNVVVASVAAFALVIKPLVGVPPAPAVPP